MVLNFNSHLTTIAGAFPSSLAPAEINISISDIQFMSKSILRSDKKPIQTAAGSPASSPVKITFNYGGQATPSKQPSQIVSIPHIQTVNFGSSISIPHGTPPKSGSSIIRSGQHPQPLGSEVRIVRPTVSNIVGRTVVASPNLLLSKVSRA